MLSGASIRLARSWWLCFVVACRASTADVRWSGDLRNLQYSALSEAEVRQLRADYAQDVAHALGVDAADVLDMQGQPGQVSLSSATEQTATTESSTAGPRPSEAPPAATTLGAATPTTTTTTAGTSTLQPSSTALPSDPRATPAPSPPTSEAISIEAAVVWHVRDHAEGQLFSSYQEAEKFFDEKAWPGGSAWAARLYNRTGATRKQYGAMPASYWAMLDDWMLETWLSRATTTTAGTSTLQPSSTALPSDPRATPAPSPPTSEAISIEAAVAWHVRDHAEGKLFSSYEEAEKFFDEKAWPGNISWAANLYNRTGAIQKQYGGMSASNWAMLDDWVRDAFGGRQLSVGGEQGTRIACQIRASTALSPSEVSRRLQEDAFNTNLAKSTEKALVNNAGAILGEISVDNAFSEVSVDKAVITTPEKDAAAEKGVQGTGSSFKEWIPQIVVVALLAFACGHALWGVLARWQTKARQCAPTGSEKV